MSEWQPIETAPKDGSKVLVYCAGAHVRSARYIESWGVWEGSDNDDRLTPTRWMPFPTSEVQS